MMTSNALSLPIGRMAVAVGTTQLIGLVFLIVFFMVGQPFGTLNDICIGLAGLLSGVLAGLLFAVLPAQPAALNPKREAPIIWPDALDASR